MTEQSPQARPESDESKRGVLCANCEHLNPAGRRTCDRCSAHLYVVCNECGHENQRVLTRCRSCRHRLHHTAWSKWINRILGRGQRMIAITSLLLAAGILGGFGIIVLLTQLRLPW